MGEGVVDGGDEPSFETRSPRGLRRILGVLSDLLDVPCVEVVLDPEPALMLEAFASSLGRGVDAPLFWEGELSNELVLSEELDGLFESGSCGKRPHKRSLCFTRGGGMIDGLLGHP